MDDEIDNGDLEDQVEVEAPEDEAEEAAEQDEAPEGEQEAEPPRRGRAGQTISDLRRERRAERERADDLERQLAKLRADFDGQQKDKDQRAYEERMANLTPEERTYHELQETKRQLQALEQKQQQAFADQKDRSEFAALAEQHPALKKLGPQVEQEYDALQRMLGRQVPRQLVAATLLGLQQLNGLKSGQLKKAADKGQQNIQRQRTPPGGGESNVRRGGGRVDPNSPEARRARLEDAVF